MEDLLDEQDISEKDLFFYKLPSISEIKASRIKSIYLGYYINWDGEKNYNFVKKFGFKKELRPRSGHLVGYDNIDEKLCEVNGWLKFLKFGFGYATDELCYEIYNKRLSRRDAIKKLKKLNNDFHPDFLDDFLRFHKISENDFYDIALKFLNKNIFEPKGNWWSLKNYPK